MKFHECIVTGIFFSSVFATNLASAADAKIDYTALRAAMADSLKDSESARFKDVKMKTDDGGLWMICGQVNAKNSYGGYAGFSEFFTMGVAGDKSRPIKQFVGTVVGDVAEVNCAREGLSR